VGGIVQTEYVYVLVDRVRRPQIPLLPCAAERVEAPRIRPVQSAETPTLMHVLDQRVRLVLGQYTDAADARIDAVGQGKVDNPEMASKGNGGFDAMGCEGSEPGPFPPASTRARVFWVMRLM